jgi:hypothetical protein
MHKVASNDSQDRKRTDPTWGQGGGPLLRVLACAPVKLLVCCCSCQQALPPALVSMAGPLTAPLLAYCSTSMPFC